MPDELDGVVVVIRIFVGVPNPRTSRLRLLKGLPLNGDTLPPRLNRDFPLGVSLKLGRIAGFFSSRPSLGMSVAMGAMGLEASPPYED